MYYYLCFFFFQEPVQEWHIFCGSGSCFFLSGSGSLFFSPPTPAPKDPKTPGSSALVKKMVSTTNTNIQSFHFSRQYYFFLLTTNLNFLILGRFPQIIGPNIYSCKNHKFWPYQIQKKINFTSRTTLCPGTVDYSSRGSGDQSATSLGRVGLQPAS